MPINLATYVDVPGSPRRAIYPDFTVGFGAAADAVIGTPIPIPHGCNLLPGYDPGLNFWHIAERQVVSWTIITTHVPPAHGFGSLSIQISVGVGLYLDWRVFALNDGVNYMEGLSIPSAICTFTFRPANNNSGLRWLIKAQGI